MSEYLPLTPEQIKVNAETYYKQASLVLDPEKTEIRYNSEWSLPLGSMGMIQLAAKYTVARMMERNDFHQRFTAGTPISVHEFLYPLMQGYDSVALKSDLELGGTDQKFNLLMGRHLQLEYGQEPQCILTMPLLEGLDGVDKMSKSKNNYIGITENPNTMFAKVLSISDELMWRWYTLLSFKSLEEIEALKREVQAGRNPKEVKVLLAREITTRFHSAAAADAISGLVQAGDLVLVKASRGTRADLVPGEYVFMAARKETDGSTTALRIQVSKDGGDTWEEVGKNIPGVDHESYVSGIEASWYDAATAYIALDRHRNNDLKPYIFKTTDYGKTWTRLDAALPKGHPLDYALSIAENPHKKGMVFAGTGHAFFYSKDDGKTWTQFKDKLPEGDEILFEKVIEKDSRREFKIPFLVKKRVMLAGDVLSDARVAIKQFNEPYVAVSFDAKGAPITRAPKRAVTLRHLLSMTSGYSDYWPQDYVMPPMLQDVTAAQIMDPSLAWITRFDAASAASVGAGS